MSTHTVSINGYGECKIIHIDSKISSRTSKQHGIAWWVSNRAVGECKWRGSDYKNILDGRTSEAKRFTFIVKADFLNDSNAVKEDWSWFKTDNQSWKSTHEIVQKKINEIISETEKSGRDFKKQFVLEKAGHSINTLPLMSKDRVKFFIDSVINECPNFGENEIFQLTTILTKLEKAKSRYGLLELLHNQEPNDFDTLHKILSDWTVGMAKIVLDEIETRLRLICELKSKLDIKGVNEVKELQPLFEKGLWMFGPQFESIEFTSNKGMTTVIREIFGNKDGIGSRNRPDFVILDDSSIGFYARSSYDDEFNENGIEHVVIIDLKTTGLMIGSTEKGQVWKYVKELMNSGYITRSTTVDGFILGDTIEQGETEPRKEGDRVKIIPLLYNTILTRAEKRLLNLHTKVKDAPFLLAQQDEIEIFMQPISVKQSTLFNCR